MTETQTWLDGGAILACLSLPDGGTDTGVVICPPLGQEHILAYRTLRLLAQQACDSGLGAIRFDYPGYGDSTVVARNSSFLDGARSAAGALVRAGCTRIVYVGLASGALIAAAAADTDPHAVGVALWDPPASGHQWLRRQIALYSMSVSPGAQSVDNGFTVTGLDLEESSARALDALSFDAALADRIPVLVAVRRGYSVPAALAGAGPEVVEVDGMEGLLDVSSIDAVIPGESLAAIRAWLVRTFPLQTGPIAEVARAPSALFSWSGRSGATARLQERISFVGPHRLFGIETTREGLDRASAPAVVLHNGSAEHRIGAARYQVVLARELAALGIRVFRFDRRGTGETTAVSADETSLLFTRDWIDDGDNVLRSLGLAPERVGVVGMCVGAWIALSGDPALTKLVVAISPNDYRAVPAKPGAVATAPEKRTKRDAVARILKRRLPYPALRILARAGRVQLVEPVLRAPLDSGTAVVLFMGPLDSGIFRERRGLAAIRRLRNRRGVLTVLEHDGGDHSLFEPGIRDAAIQETIARASAAFAPYLAPVTQPETVA